MLLKSNFFMKSCSSLLLAVFFVQSVYSLYSPTVYAQTDLNLPQPGQMLNLSESFKPVAMRGIKLDPSKPFQFNFLVDEGDTKLNENDFKNEAQKVIKYFLTSLTIPDNDLWVNLSPYEKDRIIPQEFGKTEMGRDLLAQDYILKQITASLIYPEKDLGKKFWDRVYKLAQDKYGSVEIPINTFNKVWIVPDQATVYEHKATAFVVSYHLKVMLEEDYLALDKSTVNQSSNDKKEVSTLSSEVVRSIVLPELEKEVNSGKNFASLRQIFYSLILATWYKTKLKQTILNQVYSDKKKINGVLVDDKQVKDKIYQQYLDAFKKGVFNYIKEDLDKTTNETVPRKYFSGGVVGHIALKSMAMVSVIPTAGLSGLRLRSVDGGVGFIKGNVPGDFAMLSDNEKLINALNKIILNTPELIVAGFSIEQIAKESGLTMVDAEAIIRQMEEDGELDGFSVTSEPKERFIISSSLLRDFYGRLLKDDEIYRLGDGLILLFGDRLNYTLRRAIQLGQAINAEAIQEPEKQMIKPILDRLNAINERHKGIQRDILSKIPLKADFTPDWDRVSRGNLITIINEVLTRIGETIKDIEWLQDRDAASQLEEVLKAQGYGADDAHTMAESYFRGLIIGSAHLEMVRRIYLMLVPNDALKGNIQGLFGKKGSFLNIRPDEELYVYEDLNGKTHIFSLKHQKLEFGRRHKFASYRHSIYDAAGNLEEIRIRNYSLTYTLIYRRDFDKSEERINFNSQGDVDETLSHGKQIPPQAKEALEEMKFFNEDIKIGIHVDFMNLNKASEDFQSTYADGDLESLAELMKSKSIDIPASAQRLHDVLAQRMDSTKTDSMSNNESTESVEITAEHGIHARTAARITMLAGLNRRMDIVLEHNGRRAKALSIMEVLGLGAAKGNMIIRVKGEDAESRLQVIGGLKAIINPTQQEKPALEQSSDKEEGRTIIYRSPEPTHVDVPEMNEERMVSRLKEILDEKNTDLRKGLITFSNDHKKFMVVVDDFDSLFGAGFPHRLLLRETSFKQTTQGEVQLDWFRIDIMPGDHEYRVEVVPPSIMNPQQINKNLLNFQGIKAEDLPLNSNNVKWKQYQKDGLIKIARLLTKAFGDKAEKIKCKFPTEFFPELQESKDINTFLYGYNILRIANLKLSTDKAMLNEDKALISAPGGIDLTSKRYKISIQNDGQETQMDLNSTAVRNLEFDGLEFHIDKISPVGNLQNYLINTEVLK